MRRPGGGNYVRHSWNTDPAFQHVFDPETVSLCVSVSRLVVIALVCRHFQGALIGDMSLLLFQSNIRVPRDRSPRHAMANVI